MSREEHQKTEQLHLVDKKMLQDQLHSKDRQYQEILRNAKLQHSEAVERLRQSFEERAREIEKRYSDRFVALRDPRRHRTLASHTIVHSAIKRHCGISMTFDDIQAELTGFNRK